MTPGGKAARAAWFSYWDVMRRWHRFEVIGAERLSEGGPALIAGYHGRPIAHDLCMLQSVLRARGGPEPRPIIHATFKEVPVLRWLVEGVGFVTGEGDIEEAIKRGDSIIVTPGGTREGCRSVLDRYRVEWGERIGYLRLAVKYNLPIVPVGAAGVDDTYVGLNDGYAWGKRLRVPGRLPVWVGVGPLGVWPISPPFPSKIVQLVGEPITLPRQGEIDPKDKAAWAALHAKVTGAVQGLIDRARAIRRGES